jgi:hypothetical protein
MDKHLVINILIAACGVYIWYDLRRRQRARPPDEHGEYLELLVRLKHILDTSELDVFRKAADDKLGENYRFVDDDFSKYLKSEAQFLPQYVKDFLDDGKEYILNCKINRWG